jgi:mRNA interferase YafQ
MYSIQYSNRFRKDVRLCAKRGLDITKLQNVVQLLQETGSLPQQYKPHKLVSDYAGCWECHVQPNWLLVWEQNDDELILLFTRTGTHADLF